MQIRASRSWSLTPQTRDVRILKCCVRISPRILTTDPHPRSSHRLPAAAVCPVHLSLASWVTEEQLTAAAAEHGHGVTQIEHVRQSALCYSVCSLCSVGQLAKCGAWVNDPRQSTSANFWGQAVRVSPRISRIFADLRPQADASAVRTSLLQTAVAVGEVRRVARRHGDNWCNNGHLMLPPHLPPQTCNTRSHNGRTRCRRCGRPRRRWLSGPALQRTPRATDVTRNWSCRGRLFGYFRRQMTVVEIIIAELHCLSNGGHHVDCSASYVRDGALSETVATVSLRTKRMLSMFRLRNKKCSETGPNRRCSGPEEYQRQFRFDL